MLSFPIESVRAVIARGRADAQAKGGFRNPRRPLSLSRRISRRRMRLQHLETLACSSVSLSTIWDRAFAGPVLSLFGCLQLPRLIVALCSNNFRHGRQPPPLDQPVDRRNDDQRQQRR